MADYMGQYIDTRELPDILADETLDEDERTWFQAVAEAADEAFGGVGTGPFYRDGITLIRDDEFLNYAQEFARDIGAINDEYGWPYNFVDWDAAAEALQQDFTSIEVHGTTYWGQY